MRAGEAVQAMEVAMLQAAEGATGEEGATRSAHEEPAMTSKRGAAHGATPVGSHTVMMLQVEAVATRADQQVPSCA